VNWGQDEYDPKKDPGNFPLEDWAAAEMPEPLWWDAAGARFMYGDLPVGASALRSIVGIRPYWRAGAFEQSHEEAAWRYFRHERWLRSLQPAPPAIHPYTDQEDD